MKPSYIPVPPGGIGPEGSVDLSVDLVAELPDDIATRPIFADKIPSTISAQSTATPHGRGVLPDKLREVTGLFGEIWVTVVVFLHFCSPYFM